MSSRGELLADCGHSEAINGLARRPDGSWPVLQRATGAAGTSGDFALTMFDADGRLDLSLGRADLLTPDRARRAAALEEASLPP